MHEAGDDFNKVLGWTGIAVAVAIVGYSYWQYRLRNVLLVNAESDLKKYVDNVGTSVFFVAIVVVALTGFVSYQKSVLTYNNWESGESVVHR